MTADQAQAERFAELFRAVYLTFHRRDGPRNQLAGASRAVLEHLALAGPLTIGEAAAHLARAQSVVSEIVTHLDRQGLVEREPDPADRRRTLVWLTPLGHDTLHRDREVLSVDLLADALSRLPCRRADELVAGLRALVDAAPPVSRPLGEEHMAMATARACESCGMPIETGRYCGYCTDSSGALQSFEERFERMVAWQQRRNPGATRQDLERQTLEYMSAMPAWQDHPRVTAQRSRQH
ncbi:MAG: winged helix-turn-helix transcriptional regulator [Streptosporangiaceae bacterium]|nr:winged helix-turn-helix transcriptional regulator [Streptosporangiaceae bacterium]